MGVIYTAVALINIIEICRLIAVIQKGKKNGELSCDISK